MRLVFVVLLTATCLVACKKKPPDPVREVELALHAMELAVEARDLGEIKSMMMDSYKDAEGQTKKNTVSLLQLQFLRRDSIHLLVRIQDIVIEAPERAKSEILVAAGATAVEDVSALEKVKAELLHVDITWTKDGDQWKVQRSKWRRANLVDWLE